MVDRECRSGAADTVSQALGRCGQSWYVGLSLMLSAGSGTFCVVWPSFADLDRDRRRALVFGYCGLGSLSRSPAVLLYALG